ncbi:uncharacterized protein LOC105634423 [Jatropha curcas]|uniref:uncharacterized protein LOC105634423 n=1 Tax=Jatropha curcas TaxID=180498 RepID=UPI0018932F08|nr:uncharacterized protein LOC105634423 [Jatropha curcas]
MKSFFSPLQLKRTMKSFSIFFVLLPLLLFGITVDARKELLKDQHLNDDKTSIEENGPKSILNHLNDEKFDPKRPEFFHYSYNEDDKKDKSTSFEKFDPKRPEFLHYGYNDDDKKDKSTSFEKFDPKRPEFLHYGYNDNDKKDKSTSFEKFDPKRPEFLHYGYNDDDKIDKSTSFEKFDPKRPEFFHYGYNSDEISGGNNDHKETM